MCKVRELQRQKAENLPIYIFKVIIKASDYEAALKPEVWPYRVGVRHYRAKRPDREIKGWSGQSRQSGGN